MQNSKIVRIAAFLMIVICFLALGYLDYCRGKNKRIVLNHRSDHHPVINALFARKIRLGQPLGELLTNWPPSRYSKHNNFTTLYYVKNDEESDACCGGYSTYVNIVAMNDKLVKAQAVEGVLSEIEYAFFNGFDEAAEDIYWTSRLQSITANR